MPLASESAQVNAFGSAPWLRDRLPPDTIVYARPSSPWRSVLGPAGMANPGLGRRGAAAGYSDELLVEMSDDTVATDIDVRYLPVVCRAGEAE